MTTSKYTRRDFIKVIGLGVATMGMPRSLAAANKKRPNVLFIAVDDLRPQLGCYGHKQMISPNIDKLASDGVMFLRSYCHVPVCGASRASLLTGTRPTANRFLGYDTWAEKDLSGALSVAEHFRNNGYHTISNGKVFHHRNDCRNSWSETPWHPTGPWHNYQFEKNQQLDRTKPKLSGHLQGKSFVPLLKEPNLPWKKAVFSRYYKGDSVKTDRYRYTEWRGKGGVYARMLYDHKVNLAENTNIAELPRNKELVEKMSKMLRDIRS